MTERKYVRIFLLLPALLTLYFVFRIFQPFFQPIALAVMLASLCYPIYAWIRRKLKKRASLASLVTCLLVMALIVVPFVLLILAFAREVGVVYLALQERIEAGEFRELMNFRESQYVGPVLDWISQYIDLENIDILGSLTSTLQNMSVLFLRHSTEILGGVAQLISKFFIMLVTMFFLFRDGARIVEEFKSLTPLTERYEDVLVRKFKEVTRATFLGSLLTALAQGVAGGIVFWALGISNIVFWSSMIALFSLVPVVGSALIWGPWAIYFFLTGSVVKGIVLIALAVLFIGMVDNLVRPLFIQGQAGMHTLLVFFSIMGGIAYFGMIGMIFGPIIVSLGLTFLELYRIEFKEELIKPR